MARTTTPTRSSSRRATEPAPKKRLGRPPGSKNRVPAKAKADTPRSARKSVAPAAPRLNKAELEAQLARLERAVARLRKQNAELKHAAKEAAAAPEPEPVPTRKPKRTAAAPKATRARRNASTETELAQADEAAEA